MPPSWRRGRSLAALVLGAALVSPLLPATAATVDDGPPPSSGTLTGLAVPPPELVIDLTFPAEPGGRYFDDYTAGRSGGRTHCAGDILGPKHSGVYAAVGGTITSMPMTKPSYGYAVNIQGDDGRRYGYLHLNDDRPGTNDDAAGPEHAYAAGLAKGMRVARGQLIGYLGDSGNTKGIDHLHFEIHDPAYETEVCLSGGVNRVNPYRSLRQAVARLDFGAPLMGGIGAGVVAGIGTGSTTTAPQSGGTTTTGGVARGIERACRPGRVVATAFTDLGDVHRAGVQCVAWWKVAAGTSSSTFTPTGTISRAQLATFVVNLATSAGRVLPATGVDHFDDDAGSIHEANINRVASAGIMGSSNRSYSPDLAVSRSSMAAVIAKTYRHVAGRSLPTGPDAFSDDSAEASQSSINSVAAAGIAVGYADGRFHPTVPVTREQMATFYARLLDALVEGGYTTAR